jgi:hypothetical protein
MTEPENKAAPTPTGTGPEPEKPRATIKTDWKKRAEEAEAKLEAALSPKVQSQNLSPQEKAIEPPKVPNPHSHSPDEPHYIGSWQKYCPTCGDQNPEFKDETECSDCHTSLGEKAKAEKLKACPNCGGTHARQKHK